MLGYRLDLNELLLGGLILGKVLMEERDLRGDFAERHILRLDYRWLRLEAYQWLLIIDSLILWGFVCNQYLRRGNLRQGKRYLLSLWNRCALTLAISQSRRKLCLMVISYPEHASGTPHLLLRCNLLNVIDVIEKFGLSLWTNQCSPRLSCLLMSTSGHLSSSWWPALGKFFRVIFDVPQYWHPCMDRRWLLTVWSAVWLSWVRQSWCRLDRYLNMLRLVRLRPKSAYVANV